MAYPDGTEHIYNMAALEFAIQAMEVSAFAFGPTADEQTGPLAWEIHNYLMSEMRRYRIGAGIGPKGRKGQSNERV